MPIFENSVAVFFHARGFGRGARKRTDPGIFVLRGDLFGAEVLRFLTSDVIRVRLAQKKRIEADRDAAFFYLSCYKNQRF
jgi:hypothetical protein